MKNNEEFARFLAEEVNLNQHRIDTLVQRVGSISEFLKNSGWSSVITGFSPQGSWAHQTIIKPPGEKGFDADLLVFIRPVAGWSAGDYVLKLREVFSSSGTYREMVGLRTRCVTLTYANDFTLDVVPCIVGRPGGTHRLEVCNRTDNQFEPTDGPSFSEWFSQRNDWVGNDQLRRVVRLVKYLRDIKLTFSCKSILLTTLLGNQITILDSYQPRVFTELPTSLRTLMGRLDDYLQARPELHDVLNPVLPTESFVRHWDADKYATFSDMIHTYRIWIDEAYEELDPTKSQDKWQRVFGDEFGGGKRALVASLTEAQVAGPAVGLPAFGDAVEAVKRFGQVVLAQVKWRLPWVKIPPWRVSLNQQVVISATGHTEKYGSAVAQLHSGQVLKAGLHLRFEAIGQGGQRYSGSASLHDVQWQVVNTDKEAQRMNGLRGGFEKSAPPAVRWEVTQYHGVHWIQAFVIRRRDRACVGRSERFFVVIE